MKFHFFTKEKTKNIHTQKGMGCGDSNINEANKMNYMEYNVTDIISVLKYAIEKFGIILCDDSTRLKNVLMDLSPSMTKEIKLLYCLNTKKIIRKIYDSVDLDVSDLSLLVDSSTNYLVEEELIDYSIAYEFCWELVTEITKKNIPDREIEAYLKINRELEEKEKQREKQEKIRQKVDVIKGKVDQTIINVKEAVKENRKRLIKFVLFVLITFSLIIFGVYKFREGKIQIPFDSDYVHGCNLDYIVTELEKAGFENIVKKPDTSGWLEGETVISVNIDNKEEYRKGNHCYPDVTIFVTYSSDDRVHVTDLLSGWDKKNYSELSQDLKDAGFTKITTKVTETYDKNKDNLVAGLKLNYSDYEEGECYLSKTAPIEICYYSLRINTGNSNEEFWGLDYKVVEENFVNDGFTNVQTQKVETGWQKGNTVVEVTINNKTDYAGTDAFSPDAKVVIKYSSNNRVDVTSFFSGWETKEYTTIQNALEQKGFTEVSVKEKSTTKKTQNKKIASILMNNENYESGDCYLQKTAQIVIEYYVLEIAPGRPADEFEEMNYTDAVVKLKEKGFSNITLKRANDITLGWISKEGEIKKIIIDGKKNFEGSDKFRYDAEIVIVVHTYKNKGCEDITIIDK